MADVPLKHVGYWVQLPDETASLPDRKGRCRQDTNRKLWFFLGRADHLYTCTRKHYLVEGDKSTLDNTEDVLKRADYTEVHEARNLLGMQALNGKQPSAVSFLVRDIPKAAINLFGLRICKHCDNLN